MLIYTNKAKSLIFQNITIIIDSLGSTRCFGGDSCCTESNKCADKEGDCDIDADCVDGLKCGTNNCNIAINHWDSTDDCCYKPREGIYAK